MREAQRLTTFRSLRVRNYRLYLGGQLISLTGSWMQIVAQDWLVLQLSHDSGTALGLATALQFAPMLVFTLYGGKLADRWDKRTLLFIANASWAALAIGLGLLVVTGAAQLWHVFVFAGLIGVVTAIETPTRQAFVSEMVGRDLLPNALSLNAATFNSARILGPAAAGLLIAWLGTGPVFLLNAVSYAATMVGLALMRAQELYRAARSSAPTRVVDGLRYVAGRPDLLLPLGLVLVVGGFGFNFQVTLPLLAKTVFGLGAASFGLLTTALAAGALFGALAGTGRRARPSVYVVLSGALGFGLFQTAVGFSPTFLAAVVLLVPTGFFMIYFAQAANQRVQLGTDPQIRGRVMALYVLVFFGSMPVGALLVGWLAEILGPRSGLWIGGAGSFAAAVGVFVVRSRRRGVRVTVHARPRPHVHLLEPAATEVRIPAAR